MAIAERWREAACAAVLAGLLACGGEEEPAVVPAAGAQRAAAQAAAADTTPPAPDTVDVGLVRETFAYRGAGRDPFVSLLTSGAVRPLPQDLRVIGITYDARYPQRSVATVRDTTNGTRYSLRVGDQVGRLRVVEVRQAQVVVVIEELGVERQVVLSLRRRQEETP